ncbi:MAG: pentapeptide repeat-containing protein [Candidatus Aenigmarchaeota archaeon]|nr:pentapeptide repeat-containing protein [Candidatus Aenigmarchaeota archaeon]
MPQIYFKHKLNKVRLAEFLKAYKKGERDFSNHDFQEFDFSNLDLREASFSNCNLRFTGWKDANLHGCDFSGSDIEWSSFERADLKGAKFVGANLAKSIINKAIVDENTDMTRTDLSWTLAFDINWGMVKSKGAQIATIAFSPEDITDEGMRLIQGEMSGLKNISLETKLLVQFSVSRTRTQFKDLIIKDSGSFSNYGTGQNGYGSLQVGYSGNISYQGEVVYSSQPSSYKSKKTAYSK